MEPIEPELVARALAGDPHAYEQVIRHYARLVFAQASSILRQRQEAEDITQEAFVRAHEYRIQLHDPRRFQNWLLAITRNLARDRLRRRQRTVELSDDSLELVDESATRPGSTLERCELTAGLFRAVNDLPERQRRAVILRYLNGYDYRRIERTMGLTNGAVRGVLGRGLAALRRRFQLSDT